MLRLKYTLTVLTVLRDMELFSVIPHHAEKFCSSFFAIQFLVYWLGLSICEANLTF